MSYCCARPKYTHIFTQIFKKLAPLLNIYISHHPKQLAKAKELVRFLSPMVKSMSLNLAYWGNIAPGSDISTEIFDNIQKAHLILVLATADYLDGCQEELDWIENAKCFKNNEVVPIPLGPCLWKETFLGKLMPLPRIIDYESSPFDDSARWEEVAIGVKEFLTNKQLRLEKPLKVLLARANGAMYEPSQEIIEETDAVWIGKIGSNDKVFKVIGDSMEPSFRNGDMLLTELINLREEPPKGKQVYVVRTKYQEYLVKRIGELNIESLVLVSENRLYNSLEVPLSEVLSVYKVKESRKTWNELV